MNSRWQANKIGLINFWYYDEQEFPFVKGRMLLRGSNGSGKSVTMQSIIPLLLDGNMSPERLDPFGSRDRKMISYLLEEDDGREERTGYLYLEFKRQSSDTYMTIGMGIRARRGKNLDKWYFSLTDGRRIGKDFFLYKNMGEKVTLSKKELENRIGNGGRVIERQADYMEYVNRHIFGFDTADEYKEMVDLLIQLRTPKLSKDFKPSVINEILSDSLQPLSDDDLRPLSEAIENMDDLNMNLKSHKEARQAAQKIQNVYTKYNQKLLHEKADRYVNAQDRLENAIKDQSEYGQKLAECRKKIEELKNEHQELDVKHETLEKERELLSKSDAALLKQREVKLSEELETHRRNLSEKEQLLESKQRQYIDAENQIKNEENRNYEKLKELKNLLDEMQSEADDMAFEEHAFMRSELENNLDEIFKFDTHKYQFNQTKEKISEGTQILAETDNMERQRDAMIKEREKHIRELDAVQRKVSELEDVFVQTQNEWKETLYSWKASNKVLQPEDELLRELCVFADSYAVSSDFAEVRQKVGDVYVKQNSAIESELISKLSETEQTRTELATVRTELAEWENRKEPEPERSEAVIRNRKRLEEMQIPYNEFYKVIEFGEELDDEDCNRLEEALMKMGILDSLVIDEQYKERVLKQEKGCEDRYLFVGQPAAGRSLLDVLELNEEVNDIFSNQRLTGILGSIAYGDEDIFSVSGDGTYNMGVLTGTVTGEHEAAFLGTRARERHRLTRIEECRERIGDIEERLRGLEDILSKLTEQKTMLKEEYDNLPKDTDMREALQMLQSEERNCEQLRYEGERIDRQLRELMEVLREKKEKALEIAKSLYLTCTYEVFRRAKSAAEEYGMHLVSLTAAHEIYLRSMEYLFRHRQRLEEVDADMANIRHDISGIEKEIRRKSEEQKSVQEQLSLTDYEEIRERLDYCISWLNSYPRLLHDCASRQTHEEDEAERFREFLSENEGRITEYEGEAEYFSVCYEKEKSLNYVDVPETVSDDVRQIRAYLETDARNIDRTDVISDLNRVLNENKGFLTRYNLMEGELFAEENQMNRPDGFSAKRMDISAKYQGVKITFASLVKHLDEDIENLEVLIRDKDRELFEDIMANTVSRKIRGKINSSNMWVQKMNSLMNSMNTSSGLKLNLRWRSKTAEHENQLDTRELVELLKKDYRLMSEDEAARLSAHFRSKIEEARRNARDGGGMISFYQIMKDTLDYRKWFEFQLFSQKSGERQKELTNSVFGTFSGGEKAMSMYVPLFSAVVAKYQGGRDDAPRLISLDEAFAGVDNRNIRDMFRLMAEFQFDFIINSQVLWGDCDTLDALAIYQLIRPENAKFVTIMPYLWNGHSKELLEHETEVEQRGKEIERS
ncbi:MAG: TIGR02680 family protein [Emergencia sp.]